MDPELDLRPLLRLEVGGFRSRESRRVFDAAVHVGVPAGERDSFVLRAQYQPAVDDGLRIEVLTSLVGQSPAGCTTAWVTRPGVPHPHELDLQWLSAACVAFGLHGRSLGGFFAVTRNGWLDVRTGEARTWKRLRI